MFHLDLFRVRAFAAGNLATLLAAMGRGGLQFILIIWLQGIWLPQHGYDFAQTPLWAGIYMTAAHRRLPHRRARVRLALRPLRRAPVRDRRDAARGLSFLLLIVLPVDFSYAWFALILLLNGIGMGLFAAPNNAGVMNSLPPTQRGAGAGMLATFQNSASVLSIGVFFSLMIVGLAAGLPHTMQTGLVAHGVPAADAARVSHLPPVATLFASFLGYNPMRTLLGPHVLHALPAGQAQAVTGRSFFPHLIAGPFHTALVYAFVFAIVACVVAAVASLLRGGKYHHQEIEVSDRRSRSRRRHERTQQRAPHRRGGAARRRHDADDPLLRGARAARLGLGAREGRAPDATPRPTSPGCRS